MVGHTNADGHQYLPRMLESLQAKVVKQVAACGFHTAALTEAGEVFTWGEGALPTRPGEAPRELSSYPSPPLAMRSTSLLCWGA